MCLAVPGKIEKIIQDDDSPKMAMVNFGGILREVCLDLVPEACTGDYVIVHVGYALNVIDELEAQKTIELINEILDAENMETNN